MSRVLELKSLAAAAAAETAGVLERGGLIHLPTKGFDLLEEEADLLTAAVLEPGSKNVSLDGGGALRGASEGSGRRLRLEAMLSRFAAHADEVAGALAPAYGPRLERRRTSFRPGAIETRALSARKDDKRLHVDAFPASPVQGRRIFRVFSNVHPGGVPRRWRIGEMDFRELFATFKSRVRLRRGAGLLQWAKITRGRRTPYDDVMLQLHDLAKLDEGFQKRTPALDLAFAPGSSWSVFTDGVLHAAISGQHAFEQTYLLPVEAMGDPELSPLRILERHYGRTLL